MEFIKQPTVTGIRVLSDGTWVVVDSDVPQYKAIRGEDLRLKSIIIDTQEITLRLGGIEIKLRSADEIKINGITFKKEAKQ